MAAKKKKKNTASAKKASNQSYSRQKYSVIWFTVALFLACFVFIKGQNVWTYIHNFIFGVFGVTAYFYPFLLGFVAVMFALDKTKGTIAAKIIESIVLVVLVGAAFDVFAVYEEKVGFFTHIRNAYTLDVSGGVLGALLGHPLCKAFGVAGAAITVFLLVFVFIMLITGTSLIALFKGIATPFKAVSSQAEGAYKARAEREKTTPPPPEDTKNSKKKMREVKDFDIDVSVDSIPEKRPDKGNDLDSKSRKVVETYYDDSVESDSAEDAQEIQNAVKEAKRQKKSAARTVENDNPQEGEESIDINFETEEFASDVEAESGRTIINYKFPPLTLLNEGKSNRVSEAEINKTAEKLVQTLRDFGVETQIVDVSRGPTVTRYELQPCAGVKISRITNLANDIALNLAAESVRIEAPIPGKSAVGIEVPNKASDIVGIREIIESTSFVAAKSKLTVALGKDIGGNVIVTDISKMPHGLIAGATGSGKSVCINSIVTSILYKATPQEVKLLMIDPKVVELSVYNGIPHLLIPVITEPRKAAGALSWAVGEMDKRYTMFADRGVRDIDGYNRFVDTLENEPEVERMPRIVIIIDELAELMMTAPKDVEDSVNRLAAKARAAGMHLLVATQRPSVNVITGTIKANIPTRIAFSVSSHIDSSTILDTTGAEKLLGRGDMLFNPIDASKPRRIQGCFVSDDEVLKIVEFVKRGGTANYDDNVIVEIERNAAVEKQKKTGLDEDGPEDDPMLENAIRVVVEMGQASTSMLQRRLKLGYGRASRIVDEMEARGIVGPYEGAKPRKVLITMDELNERTMRSDDE